MRFWLLFRMRSFKCKFLSDFCIYNCNFRVVEYTNLFLQRIDRQIKKKNSAFSYRNHLYETSANEIKALIGLWLKLGITGFQKSSIDEIFSTKKSCSLYAHLCFSYKHYKVLMRALRFDDKIRREMETDGKWSDKFVHIREVMLFSNNGVLIFSLGLQYFHKKLP